MEDYDSEITKQVKEHDIIAAGKNFGCGSSREQAVTCFNYSGIDAIVAKSFARLFYRNSMNSALAVIECPEAVEAVFEQAAEEAKLSHLLMKIDLSTGKVILGSQEFSFPPWDEQAMLIFKSGGLVEYTKQRLQNKS